jgi:hypothetical protein
MKIFELKRFLTALVLAAVIFAAFSKTTFGETKRIEDVQVVIARSALAPEERAGLTASVKLAINAGLPNEDVSIIVDRGLKRGIESKIIEKFLTTGVAMRDRGLPTGLVVDRIEQGFSKGVPPSKITAVTQRLTEQLSTARRVVDDFLQKGMKPLRPGDREVVIETVARAFEINISAKTIRETGELVRANKGSLSLFNRAVDMMTTFAENGMAAERAAQQVRAAVKKGYGEPELAKIEKEFLDAMKKDRRGENVRPQTEHQLDREPEREDREGMRGERGRGPGRMR